MTEWEGCGKEFSEKNHVIPLKEQLLYELRFKHETSKIRITSATQPP
jgi:hypothetical protein